MREKIGRRRVHGFVLLAVLALGAFVLTGASAGADNNPLPQPITHQPFNAAQPLTASGDGAVSEANFKNPPSPICLTSPTSSSNVNTDCETTAPNNETAITVNPTNAQNLVGSANDYQLFLSSGGKTNETAYSRAHVSFDGGKSWTLYPISYSGYTFTGDPGVAFDADGTAYLSTLGFVFGQGAPTGTNPDVLVAHSTNGGKAWSKPSRVASSSGSFGSVGNFNDKEAIAAWGHGNAIVTWTLFTDTQFGGYGGSPIYDSVTHDSGQSWSAPTQISGSAPFCVGFGGGTACNQDQGSVPTVGPDGSIYVSFLSERDTTNGRDQYLVVKVDPTTGARVGGPFKVADLTDGVTDYPVNEDATQTYQDSEFRTWSFGNVTADPTKAGHVAVVWSDMRNSQLPAPSDPYQAKTNSDVGVSQSFDGGQTWSAPTIIKARGDQFMPWGAYDGSGLLRIGYFDRSYDAANHKYGYTLATETSPGSLHFSTAQVTTALSDPTQNDRWFSGRTPNPAFPHPSSFIGDYSGIAASPTGGAATYWTDMRLPVCFTSRCGAGEDAFYTSIP